MIAQNGMTEFGGCTRNLLPVVGFRVLSCTTTDRQGWEGNVQLPYLPYLTANLLTLLSSKTEFLLIGLRKQLAKIHDSSLSTTHSARNLGFIFDEHLSFSDQISTLSQSCYHHIRQLRCIRRYLDFKTASTIATSIVHSKLDYCNSLCYDLPKFQITCLQQIQSSLARPVVKAPKFCRIAPILHSLHWLKITERIEYNILSITYEVLTTAQHSYLHHLITVCLTTAPAPHLWSLFPVCLHRHLHE